MKFSNSRDIGIERWVELGLAVVFCLCDERAQATMKIKSSIRIVLENQAAVVSDILTPRTRIKHDVSYNDIIQLQSGFFTYKKGSLFTFVMDHLQAGSPVQPELQAFRLTSDNLSRCANLPSLKNVRFGDHDLLLSLANTKHASFRYGFLRTLTAVRSTVSDIPQGKDRVMTTIKIDGFWGDSRVVVANSIKPKMVEGVFLTLFLNATSGTHVSFDNETDAENSTFYEPRNTHVPSFLRGYAKVEPLPIAELNEFVIISEPQVVQSVFTVHEEAPPNGLILYLRELKYLGLLRYHVEMSIADDTVEGCLCWIRLVMTKLHNVRAYEAGNLIVGTSLSGIAIKKPQASKSLKVMKKLRVVMQMEYLLFQK
ncbi:LOW QUALITY PROTEIN: hypothetical protein HID58_002157 [Brassica napus]|uniref:Uncharacterized protein n=1 Tax=Brassica napus TaxID=3708 RepID=A0ABQ8EPE8_BRANA|nr:LOW QUALITY PROTEIN: hypothetical protein HID58_002157 [Brassica napus]